jgi:type IV pilus assembly protein PilA
MSSRKCPQCGLVNWSSAETCKRCELDFTAEAAPPPPEGEVSSHATQYSQVAQYSAPAYGEYPPPHPAQKSTGLAIASLILAILSFLTLGMLGVGAVAAFVMGIMALRKAKKMPAHYGGEGIAIAGIVLSSISALMFAYVAIIAAIAIPNLLAARRAANEAGVVVTLRRIAGAEATFASTKGAGRRYGTLQELVDEGLIEPSLASSVKYGYRFELRLDRNNYEVTATPLTYGRASSPGNRSFYLSDSGLVRAADRKGLAASASDPPLVQDEEVYTRPGRRSLNNPDYSPEY